MNPDDLNVLTEENLGSPTILISVVEAAARKNSWRILGSVEAEPQPGHLQHGHCLVERNGKTLFDSDLRFSTHQWVRNPDGSILFNNGVYDMTREDALADFLDRI